MTPFFDNGMTRLYVGHVLDVLKALPDESVQCVVTSPPYWVLCDYKIKPQVWGGVATCAHTWEDTGIGRNKRTVWAIATQPYPEAHFATYPEALVEPCLLAGTSERGACVKCGAPWRLATETIRRGYLADGHRPAADTRQVSPSSALRGNGRDAWTETTTTGWAPMCRCGTEETVPCTILDCFAGSGTTLAVAQRLFRRSIGIDLSPDYAILARDRILAEGLPLEGGTSCISGDQGRAPAGSSG